MARRHKPTLLKLVTGSKRLPRHPEPQPAGDLKDPPEWLSEAQKEAWRYAIANSPAGLLRRIDAGVLTIWCVAEATFREASEQVARHGLLIKSPEGTPLVSPYVHIRNRQMVIVLRAAAELGFSPVSRPQIHAPDGGGNPFTGNGRRPT